MMFEFPWFFWIMFFVIFFGCGRMCGWGARRYIDRRHRSEDDEEGYHLSGSQSSAEQLSDRGRNGGGFIGIHAGFGLGEKEKREPARLKGRGERGQRGRRGRRRTPLQQLQRKFVDGRITLEEYERQVDALERLD